MAGLKPLAPGVTFAGIGGPEMAAQGLQSRFDMCNVLPPARKLGSTVEHVVVPRQIQSAVRRYQLWQHEKVYGAWVPIHDSGDNIAAAKKEMYKERKRYKFTPTTANTNEEDELFSESESY